MPEKDEMRIHVQESCTTASAAACNIFIRSEAVNKECVNPGTSAHQASHFCDLDVSVINQKYKLLFTETLISTAAK